MANLVSPGYRNSVLVNQVLAPQEERIIEFKGLNKRTVVEEGEMSDMWNLCTDMYPVLKPRKPRGVLALPSGIRRPIQILQRFDKLGVIAIDEPEHEEDPVTVSFWYDGEKVTEVNDLTIESYAVAINNQMCFFPQKTKIDITIDGVQRDEDNPSNTYKSLEVDYPITNLSVVLSNEDAKIQLPSGHGFKYDDALNIHISSYTAGGTTKTTSFDISCIIEEVQSDTPSQGTDTIVLPRETFIEMTGEGVLNFSISGRIKREMPDLDYVMEWNNRLWGCSSAENIIYACKLGDPTNWHYYQGTGLDSYYAQQGTDERWTGIAEYSGHILFFKPNSITRVYGTAPSNFQVTATKAYGIEPGSSKSVLTINDMVFYKSEVGVMVYQGGTPVCISDKLSHDMKNVVAGTEGTKYYASAIVKEDGQSKGLLFVYDIARGMWHIEDNFRFTDAIKIGDKIYCVTTSATILFCGEDVYCADDLYCTTDAVIGDVAIINPDRVYTDSADALDDWIEYMHNKGIWPTLEEVEEFFEHPSWDTLSTIPWMATFGPFDEWLEEHKIYSKLALRMISKGPASARVYIKIEDGEWEQIANIESISTKGDFIPIIPRRCDRYSIKIEGTGMCEIKSLTRRIRKGSFGRL